jgi:hypothetical protein
VKIFHFLLLLRMSRECFSSSSSSLYPQAVTDVETSVTFQIPGVTFGRTTFADLNVPLCRE